MVRCGRAQRRRASSLQKSKWSAAAPSWEKWDAWFDRYTGPLTDWLCSAAALSPGKRVLDLACGSGQPAVTDRGRACARVGSVVATNLSGDMVEQSRGVAAQPQASTTSRSRVMDAERLELPSGSFDAVTCRFGLMFCPDPVGPPADPARPASPAWQFAVAVWDEPAPQSILHRDLRPIAQFALGPPPDPKRARRVSARSPGELEAVLRAGRFLARFGREPATETRVQLTPAAQMQSNHRRCPQ